jgi:hypothetical protein
MQLIPESARFYVVQGKTAKAERVIKRIAWFNCRSIPKVTNVILCTWYAQFLVYHDHNTMPVLIHCWGDNPVQ